MLTASFDCDVRQMRELGVAVRICAMISAMSVVLPVPGGPWITEEVASPERMLDQLLNLRPRLQRLHQLDGHDVADLVLLGVEYEPAETRVDARVGVEVFERARLPAERGVHRDVLVFEVALAGDRVS